MNAPLVSVFIVNFNTCELLEKCLASVFAGKKDVDIKVFVADNASDDGSVDMIQSRFAGVSVIKYSANRGFTLAVNPLIAVGKGRYNLFLHPDVEVLPQTLDAFIGFLEARPQVGILGGNLYYPDGSPNPCEIAFPSFKNDLLSFAWRLFSKLPGRNRLAGGYNPIEWSHKSTTRVNWVWNACMMVRREVFEQIGYFDEKFFVWYADWDLCKRAADAGWSIYYLYPAKAIHYERHSFKKENLTQPEILYKVDGWFSSNMQMRDRQTFLQKHSSPWSIYGSKSVYFLENALRFFVVLCNLAIRGITSNEAVFQLKTCLRNVQTILRA